MITSTENVLNSKSRLLRLSTEDKVFGTQGRFQIDLASASVIDTIKGYMVHSISCPNVFDNVPTWANGIQVIKTTGLVVYDIVLTNSYYFLDDFIAELQTKINASIADSVVITKSGLVPNQKIAFTFSGDEYTLNFLHTSLSKRLGLTGDLVCPDGVLTSVLSIPNLTGETELYIHSRTIAPNNCIEGSGSFSIVDKLNLDKPYGAVCYSALDNERTHLQTYFPYESLKTFRTINITLRNRTGNILVLPDNFDFTMMLKIYYA